MPPRAMRSRVISTISSSSRARSVRSPVEGRGNGALIKALGSWPAPTARAAAWAAWRRLRWDSAWSKSKRDGLGTWCPETCGRIAEAAVLAIEALRQRLDRLGDQFAVEVH